MKQTAVQPNLRQRRNNRYGYLFIAPWLFGLVLFSSLPILASLYLSFTSYDSLGAPKWIGLRNYIKMFNDATFYKSLGVTFKYVFLLVPLRLGFSLLIAMILSSKHKGIGVYRTVYYIPSLLGGSVAIAIIWGKIFGSNGAVNAVLTSMGLGNYVFNWVGEPSTALYSLILLGIWHFGSSMLIFISGIKQIPQTYYEAAMIDGASSLQRFWRVTLPMLTPVIFFNLVMGIITAFKSFTESLVITGGGPMNSTLLFALYIYQQGFSFFKMGYASAMSWVLLLIISLFSVFVFRGSEKWVHYEA